MTQSSFLKLLATFLLCATCAPVMAAAGEEPGLTRDSAEYAACVKRLDGQCIVRLSYTDGYIALGSRGTTSRQWRDDSLRAYETLRTRGGSFESVEIRAATVRIEGSKLDYAFLPCTYVYRTTQDGFRIRRTGFLLAVSEDEGQSWMFMEAFDIPLEQLKAVVPEYDSEPLPPYSMQMDQTLPGMVR